MTINYEDVASYRRRWDNLTDEARHEASSADPLLFLADHIALADRSRGSLALFTTVLGTSTMVIIPEADPDLDAEGCFNAVASYMGRLCEDAGLDDFWLEGQPVVEALGIVHHRTGGTHVTDLDRWWAEALAAVCQVTGTEPVGVIARTRAGAIVRVPLPPEALRRAS